jgi:glutamine amidotransferase
MKVTIVDYGLGNLGSIQNIIRKLGYDSEISSDFNTIENATKIILPGVGSFDRAMLNLKINNFKELLKSKAQSGTPILGICLGMQLLANSSEEGELEGLGLIPGRVTKFILENKKLKIPHMGWNTLNYNKNSPLFNGFEEFEETRFYFVHSYHYVPVDDFHSIATTVYEKPFTSSISKEKVFGVQFHPEKSHKFGMKLLKNFIELV